MSEPICFRCRRPLGKRYEAWFSQKFHPSCKVMFHYLYREMREHMMLDKEPMKRIPFLLWWVQPASDQIDMDNPPSFPS